MFLINKSKMAVFDSTDCTKPDQNPFPLFSPSLPEILLQRAHEILLHITDLPFFGL
jgi:hypothetical protein